MRATFLFAMLLVAPVMVSGQSPKVLDASVADTLRRFDDAKPDDSSLAFYSLDWVCSLQKAKERARVENRYILLILNTNITAHCNFYSGHT